MAMRSPKDRFTSPSRVSTAREPSRRPTARATSRTTCFSASPGVERPRTAVPPWPASITIEVLIELIFEFIWGRAASAVPQDSGEGAARTQPVAPDRPYSPCPVGQAGPGFAPARARDSGSNLLTRQRRPTWNAPAPRFVLGRNYPSLGAQFMSEPDRAVEVHH